MSPGQKINEIIHSLIPGAEITALEEVNIGWSSRIYILNGEYAIKLPKTKSGSREVEKEMKITHAIRALLPVAVPRYVSMMHGGPQDAYAYMFIPGTMLTRKPLEHNGKNFDPTTVPDRSLYVSIQKQLSGILAAIHGIGISVVRDTLQEFDGETWSETYTLLGAKFSKSLSKAFPGRARLEAETLLENIISSISSSRFAEKFIHGDFGGWNILFDENSGKITGLLDWGDCRLGDPAVDFTEMIYDYGETYAREVLAYYGQESEKTLLERAKLYLKLEGFRDLHYGLETGSKDFIEKGRKNIENMIEGPY